MSTFLTLTKRDVLKEHIKIRKKWKDSEKVIMKRLYPDSAGKSQYRDTSIIHILFQSENLWKRKQFSEAVSRKKQEHLKAKYISSHRQWSGIYIVVRYIGYLY